MFYCLYGHFIVIANFIKVFLNFFLLDRKRKEKQRKKKSRKSGTKVNFT